MTFEETMVEHCAPVLAGIKLANLFRYTPHDLEQFFLTFQEWKGRFAPLGLQLIILKGCRKSKSYLIYLYRKASLKQALVLPNHQAFLCSMGYPGQSEISDYLRRLAQRLCLEKEFPHEIGIFLGYPLEDVEGFIRHGGKNCTCSGCWKSYGDPGTALRTFARFRKCTEVYRNRYASGVPITQLIVAA